MSIDEIEINQRLETTIIKFQLVSSDKSGDIIVTETKTDVNKMNDQ